ncbi:cytochrome c maturation protein CcmE [Mailhella massiliensis]|uniref:Cytochrome c maturation protein CcmE n=1 Tax=Mailhella massiliensis TaxID=1903261 RepID=A0A921AW50_9BACT|nr:cytochrome c maturation protein CcmE [Mailhella massiliensis]HJD97000.1 cytochrome c maturation protein CcmE [Mailhella massiliensis]
MSAKKNLCIYLTAFALFAGGAGFMLWSALSEGTMYHLNVSEAIGIPSEKLKSARLFGVAGGDIVKPENGLGASFTLVDLAHPEQGIRVHYRGALPDTFEKGSEVIVEGSMNGAEFTAKTLMTKCPSKYEKSNREKA